MRLILFLFASADVSYETFCNESLLSTDVGNQSVCRLKVIYILLCSADFPQLCLWILLTSLHSFKCSAKVFAYVSMRLLKIVPQIIEKVFCEFLFSFSFAKLLTLFLAINDGAFIHIFSSCCNCIEEPRIVCILLH